MDYTHNVVKHRARRPAWQLRKRVALTLLLAAGLFKLDAPVVWWDEGWSLAVARTWVEQGHYGRLLDGQRAPHGLQGAFAVIAPVALSFKLFGIGVWQRRLPMVFFAYMIYERVC